MHQFTFHRIQSAAFDLLQNGIDNKYSYHNLRHTKDVLAAVQKYARMEKLDKDQTLLVTIAAVFHDIGFIEDDNDHEKHSVQICRMHLKQMEFETPAIEFICDLILATKLPMKPNNHLQRLLCDADFDYLGREDYFSISMDLRREWERREGVFIDEEWLVGQRRFLKEHKYFSKTGRNLRQVGKEKNLQLIEKMLITSTGFVPGTD